MSWSWMRPRLAADVALPVIVALVLALTISVAQEDATRQVDALAYLVGAAIAALLVLRRRWPLGVLAASIGLLIVYFALGYPGFSPALPLAAAAYWAALAGRTLPAAAMLAVFAGVGAAWRVLEEDASAGEVLGQQALTDIALLAAVLLLGEAVRHRRAWAAEVRERLERAEADRRREAERRAQEERLHIARELHDVLAHTITGLNVQAGLAADVIDDDPAAAKQAVRAIRRQARHAIDELRATIGLLRDRSQTGAQRSPAPGLADLDRLVETATQAGVQTRVAISGDSCELAGATDLTAYRIVQESLTNVVRHAGARTADVLVRYEPDTVVVRIDDDGRGANGNGNGNGTTGHGIAGMRERAAALGGTLAVGPRPEGGFRVQARLPLRRERT